VIICSWPRLGRSPPAAWQARHTTKHIADIDTSSTEPENWDCYHLLQQATLGTVSTCSTAGSTKQ
jgi:hypothetical protein